MKCPLCGGKTFLKSQSVLLACEQAAEVKVCEHCGYVLAFNLNVVHEQTKRKEDLEKLKADLAKLCEKEKVYKTKVPSVEKEYGEMEECRKKVILLIKHNPDDPDIKRLEKRMKELDEIIDKKTSNRIIIKYREILNSIEFLKKQILEKDLAIKQNEF